MTVTLTLDRKLDYRVIAPLADELKASLGQDIVLDATGTAQIGAQAVQILIAAAKACHAAHCSLRFVNASVAVEGQLALLGLTVADVEAGGDAQWRAWS